MVTKKDCRQGREMCRRTVEDCKCASRFCTKHTFVLKSNMTAGI
jgi:hypothetical protein